MLHAIMEATCAEAGAVCLYDIRQRMLRLAAERGLSDEGCRRLRTVHRDDPAAWDMPLHGLLAGRAYLIENAARNRFVPPLVEDAANMQAVVCLPLYVNDKPLASIILITVGVRTFDERQLHAVSGPLAEMGKVIEATRQRTCGRNELPTPSIPSLVAPPTPADPTIPPGSVDEGSDAARPARLEPGHERLSGEPRQLRELRGEVDRLRAQLRDAEATVTRERRAREHLETRLAGASTTSQQELQRAHEAEREAANARATALAEVTRLRGELDRVRLQAARTPVMATEVDARVAQLLTEVDQLRASLAAAQAGAAHEQRAREELESLLARGASAGQLELRQALEAARAAESARVAAVAEATYLRSELERARLDAGPVASGADGRDERIRPLLTEIDRLRAHLAEAEAGAAHEHRAREELEARFARGLTTSQDELRVALDAARQAEEERAITLAELARMRTALERAQAEAARAPGPAEEVDARVTALAAEIDRLRARLAAAEAGAAHEHRTREELEARLTAGADIGQQELRKALEAAARAERERAAALAEAARLKGELEQARLAPLDASERAPLAEAHWRELTAEIDRLRTRVAESEAGAAHAQQACEALEASLTQSATAAEHELQRAHAGTRRADEANALARAEISRLTTAITQARDDAARLSELRTAAEGRAESFAAEAEQLRARLAEAEARAAHELRAREEIQARLSDALVHGESELQATVTAAREAAFTEAQAEVAADRDRLAAELAGIAAAQARLEDALAATREERDAHKQALDAALARLEEVAARLAQRDAELEALRSERSYDVTSMTARLEQNATETARLRETLAAISTDRDRLAAMLDGAAAAKAHLERSFHEALEASRGREQSALTDGQRLAAQLAERDSVLQLLRDEHAAEAAALRERVEALLAEAHELRAAGAALAADRDRLAADLEGAAAGTTRLEQTLEAALKDTRTREDELYETRARLWEEATRLVDAETALETLAENNRTAVATSRRQLEDLRVAADEIRGAHAAVSAERDRLAADLQGANAAKARLEEALRETLERTRAQHQEAMSDLEQARAQLWDTAILLNDAERRAATLAEHSSTAIATLRAHIETLDGEADQLRENIATVGAERDRLAADFKGAATAQAYLEGALKHALEASRLREQEAEIDVHEARGQAWAAAARSADVEAELAAREEDLAMHSARVTTLGEELDRLHRTDAALNTERDQLAAELASARAAHDELELALQQALADSRSREEALATQLAERERVVASLEPVHATETKAPPSSPPPSPPSRATSSASAASPRCVVVLDHQAPWKDITLAQHDVTVIPPEEDVITRLAGITPGRVVANLAIPGVLSTLLAFRARGVHSHLWGYIASDQFPGTLSVGLIEPGPRPLAPDAIVAALAPQVPAHARVVTAGGDVDGLLSLRQALARQGMAVSLAWDALQAADLLDMVRPDAVVVDLGPTADACGIIAHMVSTTPVSITVLIEGADDPARALAGLLAKPTLAAHAIGRRELLAAVTAPVQARSLKGARPAAPGRVQPGRR